MKVATSIFLRLLGAISKFFLFIYLAKNSTETLGILGVVIAVVAIGVQFVGAEIYNINSREIASASSKKISALINAQLKLHLLFYLVAIPLLSIFFYYQFIQWELFFWVALLLVSEHLSQELMRLLIFIFRPVISTFILFVRNGLWVLVFILFIEVTQVEITPALILKFWAFFSVLAVLIGVVSIRDYLIDSSDESIFKPMWIKEVLFKASPFMIAVICFTVMQHVDRFVLDKLTSNSELSVYFFFLSLASSIYLMVSFSVGIFYHPLAVRTFQEKNYLEYQEIKKVFIRKSIIFGSFWVLVAIFGLHPLLIFIDKREYFEYESIFYICVVTNIVLIFSDFSNLELYVRGLDIDIMWTTVFGLIFATVIQIAFVWQWGVIGAAMGGFLSAVFHWYMRNLMFKNAMLRQSALIVSTES